MPSTKLPDFCALPDILRAAQSPKEKGLATFTRSLNAVDWLSFDENTAPQNYLADALRALSVLQERSHWEGLRASNARQIRDDLTALNAPQAFLALMGEFILRDFYPRDLNESIVWNPHASVFSVMALTALNDQRGGNPLAERAICALAVAGVNQRDRRAGDLDLGVFPESVGHWLRPRQKTQILDRWVDNQVAQSRELTPGQAWPAGVLLDNLMSARWVSRADFPEWLDQVFFDPKSRVSPSGADPDATAQMALAFFRHMEPEAILDDRRLPHWAQAMNELAQSPKDYLSRPWAPVAGQIHALVEQLTLREALQSVSQTLDSASMEQSNDAPAARSAPRL